MKDHTGKCLTYNPDVTVSLLPCFDPDSLWNEDYTENEAGVAFAERQRWEISKGSTGRTFFVARGDGVVTENYAPRCLEAGGLDKPVTPAVCHRSEGQSDPQLWFVFDGM
ncbi:hypothetical protein ACF1BN_37250 [Streptomyces sp. NPDC014861]|uniref:hypothetical protein n=1 Tax=Streptomyces sp. NPDC014861 TaxID=3364923 RepID=UPI0036FAADBD